MWRCDECHANNRPVDRSCERCGASRPAHTRADSDPPPPTPCPHDGTPLYANGYCPEGQGFPLSRSCPFVCDRCRRPLSWQGTCLSCEAYAPGDRYEYDEKNPHWRMVEKSPFSILSPQENAAHARTFAMTIARLTARLRLDP